MPPTMRQGIRNDESGFTLIELLVVVLIIGILAAIAIPAYLGQRESAQDASAKSAVRQAHTAAEAYATNNGASYTNMTVTLLEEIEPTLREANDFTVDSAMASEYKVSVKSPNGSRTFSVARTATSVLRSCTPAGGGCRTTAAGVNGW